jgi:hypothetical protein
MLYWGKLLQLCMLWVGWHSEKLLMCQFCQLMFKRVKSEWLVGLYQVDLMELGYLSYKFVNLCEFTR